MSETNSQKTMIIPHTTSAAYADLQPSGYIFLVNEMFVKLTYYHDELRPIMETVAADGTSTYQTQSIRVQDVSVSVPLESFVKLVANNLRIIQDIDPSLLLRNQITLGA